nr:hypothetical protein CFP56_71441 [Quercus suber]
MSDTKDEANVLQADTRLVDSKSDTLVPSPKELEAQPDDGTSAEPITLSKSLQKTLILFLAGSAGYLAMWVPGWVSIKNQIDLEGLLIMIVFVTGFASFFLRKRPRAKYSYPYGWILEIAMHASAFGLAMWVPPRVLRLCGATET